MEKQKFEVWIASVCATIEGVKYLKEAVLSALKQSFNPVVRISIFTMESLETLNPLIEAYPERIFITKQPNLLSQFDNLAYLCENSKLSASDWVIFLDDDDILLNMGDKLDPNINGFVGYQYIGVTRDNQQIPENGQVNVENVQNFISTNSGNIMEADDFSGTSLRFEYVREYFKFHRCSRITRMLEDTTFMEFIEQKVPDIKDYRFETPFVFHRIKSGPSIWQEQLSRVIPILP